MVSFESSMIFGGFQPGVLPHGPLAQLGTSRPTHLIWWILASYKTTAETFATATSGTSRTWTSWTQDSTT